MENSGMGEGEMVHMEDAIDDIEADVFSQYLYSFSKNDSEQKKYKELAKRFKLYVDEVERIIWLYIDLSG